VADAVFAFICLMINSLSPRMRSFWAPSSLLLQAGDQGLIFGDIVGGAAMKRPG